MRALSRYERVRIYANIYVNEGTDRYLFFCSHVYATFFPITRWLLKARENGEERLSAFSSNSASELDILRHDRHALGVDRAQVGVLEKTHQIRLGRLLQRSDGCRLEPQIGLEVLRDLSDKTLERELADEQLR